MIFNKAPESCQLFPDVLMSENERTSGNETKTLYVLLFSLGIVIVAAMTPAFLATVGRWFWSFRTHRISTTGTKVLLTLVKGYCLKW